MRIAAAIFSVTAFLIVTAAALLASGTLRVPDRFNPWGAINVEDAPNWLTTYKLKRLADDPRQCLATLGRMPLRFTPLPDSNRDLECALRNTVRVNQSGVAYSSSFMATCPLAVAMALFERHALQPAAESAFGQPVAGVTHLGTYACRNVYGRESGRRSQHATANAIDLASFRLKDGKTVSVLRDWNGIDAEANFLRDVKARACRIFPTLLGPDYNAAHANHFHLDMGGFSICR